VTAPTSRHHLRLLPATRIGWGSLACSALSPVALAVAVAVNERAWDGPLFAWLFLGSAFGWPALALAGGIAAFVDLVASREKALLLLLPIVYGLAWLEGLILITFYSR
jgi:hypothetical protein